MKQYTRIFVTGARGMLGQDVVTCFQEQPGVTVVAADSSSFNLLQTENLMKDTLTAANPDLIIHCAAFTNVDGAETQPELAMIINKDGTRRLATLAKDLNIPLVYISTDYVFDGQSNEPYRPTDRANPISIYGWSKYYGEILVQELMDEYYVCRTSWLYGLSKNNFVSWVLESAREGQEVNAFEDQVGSPTWTMHVAQMIQQVVTRMPYGVYHLSNQGMVSRYQQAIRICELAGLSAAKIKPAQTADRHLPAPRPRFSPLIPEGLPSVPWETAAKAYIEQYFKQHG